MASEQWTCAERIAGRTRNASTRRARREASALVDDADRADGLDRERREADHERALDLGALAGPAWTANS